MEALATLAGLRREVPPGLRVAVAAAADPEVLATVKAGLDLGLTFTLFGDPAAMQPLMRAAGLADGSVDLSAAADPVAAAAAATRLVHEGGAQILMKGLVGTADLLRPVLARENGLRQGQLLSHVGVIELPGPRLVLLTDAGLNIAPSLAEKAEIVRNAAGIAKVLGQARPKAAALAAVELVNPAMTATVEAAALAKMAARGQLGEIELDGPLALDNALSAEAAGQKGIVSAVAGAADILLVPEITAGNLLYKALVHVAGLDAAGVVAGASAPIVVTSRADRWQVKLNSLALAGRLCRR